MSQPTLDTIASAKAKLAEELRKLEEEESQLRQQKAADAFVEVMGLLSQYGDYFTAKQKTDILTVAGVSSPERPKRAATAKKEVAPKYWLPHSGETWSGRGRTPRAFVAWEGTAAYNAWKATHPSEKFPAFPG